MTKDERYEFLKSHLCSDSIFSDDSVIRILMNVQIKRIKSIHQYAITPPKDSSGRWQTYFKNESGKRKCVKASSENELYEKLIVLYATENIDNHTFYDLYVEWLAYKSNLVNSPNTIVRHKQHYRKYFQSSILNNMPYQKIDSLLLESECNRIIKEFDLSRKEWNNAKSILKGMFSYALRKKYITNNPMDTVQTYVKFRQVNHKTGKTQTYNTEEAQRLNKYLEERYLETHDGSFMAIALNFYLGLRIGELVALKWIDIEETTIHICREEVRNQANNTISVAEHTKTHQDRFVILVSKAVEILSKIEHQGEFIFMRNGERLTERQLSYVLEKYAQTLGIATKSSHKIRKTYASNLASHGVPLDAIREQLGHNNLQTTLSYIYNPLTENETKDLIERALA